MKYPPASMPALWLALLLTLTGMLPAGSVAADTIYKYKDAEGHWHFGDKKPASDADYKQITSAQKKKKQIRSIAFHIDRRSQPQLLIAENLLFAPLTLQLTLEGIDQPMTSVLKPRTEETVYAGASIPKFKYRYLLGDLAAKIDNFAYATPFAAYESHKITQGFNGRFSHHDDSSRYAIDIQLPVGTYVTAARAGVVVALTDGFVIGGVSSKYFLDKANHVLVVHDDGSFATYVHLLPGTITVKPGTRVAEGDVLGRSGSSGYSSGPHLHFAILKASQAGLVSTPFQLRNANDAATEPVQNQMLAPARRPTI